MLVAQFTGAFWLSATALGLIGLGLLALWVLLTLLSVAVFEREIDSDALAIATSLRCTPAVRRLARRP